MSRRRLVAAIAVLALALVALPRLGALPPDPTPEPAADDEAAPAEGDADGPVLSVDEADALPEVADEPDVEAADPQPVPTDDEGLLASLSDLDGAPTLVADGRGWGHGVGLSQYGARAMARHGRDHPAILAHYYPGTAITALEQPVDLRVGLVRADPRDEPAASFAVVARRRWEDGAVTAWFDRRDPVPLPRDERVTLRADGDDVVVDVGGDQHRAGTVHLDWNATGAEGAAVAFPDLTERVPATRWGRVHVTAVDGAIRPTLVIDTERYLRGLAEVPPTWPPAALRAQAVAARTYALRAAAEGVDPACACHLGPTDHDQVFRGWATEADAGAWLDAVADTAGRVVTRDGGLVWTYYSSSHGGRTERSVDSFAFGPDNGQWPSVADPWSLNAAAENPRAQWRRTIAHDEFVDALGVDLAVVVGVDIVERSAGGSPYALRVAGLRHNGLPLAFTWRGGDGRGAAAWLRRELGGETLPSQQLTDLRVVP